MAWLRNNKGYITTQCVLEDTKHAGSMTSFFLVYRGEAQLFQRLKILGAAYEEINSNLPQKGLFQSSGDGIP